MSEINSRRFLKQTAATSAVAFPAVLTQKGLAAKGPASERVRVGMIGAAGRAGSLNRIFARNKNAEIVGIAEIDPRRLPGTLESVTKTQGSKPKTFTDFRKLVEDPTIDALCVGTPDHWHAIPTILGCISGKDVYVEKPDGHDIVEGQRMVQAMRKHKRIIQMGSQHRSTERMQTALAYIRGDTWVNALWPRRGKALNRAILAAHPMAWLPRRWIMICGWVLRPSVPLIPGASTAAGGGFMITALGTSAMTVCTGWTWHLPH